MSSILSPYCPNSWLHPIGIKKVLKRIEHRLPNVENCLFITLTINPDFFENETSAFDHARDKIRRLFYRLRKGVTWENSQYILNAPYAVKLEFHENGWPHFHIIFLCKRYLPRNLIDHLWGYGWTKVDRINEETFDYLLKYVTKSATLPEWVLSKSRIRIFQSSHGFLKPDKTRIKKTPKVEGEKSLEKKTSNSIGERLERWASMAKLTNQAGQVETIEFPCSFKSIFDHLILKVAQDGRYLGGTKIEIQNRKEINIWLIKSMNLKDNPDSSSKGLSSQTAQD